MHCCCYAQHIVLVYTTKILDQKGRTGKFALSPLSISIKTAQESCLERITISSGPGGRKGGGGWGCEGEGWREDGKEVSDLPDGDAHCVSCGIERASVQGSRSKSELAHETLLDWLDGSSTLVRPWRCHDADWEGAITKTKHDTN